MPPLRPLASRLALAAALLGLAGCEVLTPGVAITEQSLLKAALPADDAVTLDIYWVRLPAGGDDGAEQLEQQVWSEVQEDRLAVGLRRRLAANGLRAGVVGATPPDALLRLLDPEGRGDTSTSGVVELHETGVRRRTRQMRPGSELELNASEVLPESPLLVARGGKLSGKTYQRVQGVYVLEVDRAGDERVTISLLPEVRHGEQLLQFVSDETGAFTRGGLERAADRLDDLRVEAELAAGESLLVTGLPDAGSRVGGLFHHVDAERKAILIRVVQAPATTAFFAATP